ncbi:hypothetical protein VP01_2004g1 [Puccinia sorghi]|uniref:Uncharacterized protein n=1 Tax=Puccinia sorghi TaxID=27349 RepID=A0A0L6VBC6_9BASI|nr:hypothetical protein VP01_2004g1 [Puccinia sorghi]
MWSCPFRPRTAPGLFLTPFPSIFHIPCYFLLFLPYIIIEACMYFQGSDLLGLVVTMKITMKRKKMMKNLRKKDGLNSITSPKVFKIDFHPGSTSQQQISRTSTMPSLMSKNVRRHKGNTTFASSTTPLFFLFIVESPSAMGLLRYCSCFLSLTLANQLNLQAKILKSSVSHFYISLFPARHCKKKNLLNLQSTCRNSPGSFCCYSNISPKVIQPSFDAQPLYILRSDCAKTSIHANRWSLDGSLAECQLQAVERVFFFSTMTHIISPFSSLNYVTLKIIHLFPGLPRLSASCSMFNRMDEPSKSGLQPQILELQPPLNLQPPKYDLRLPKIGAVSCCR